MFISTLLVVMENRSDLKNRVKLLIKEGQLLFLDIKIKFCNTV